MLAHYASTALRSGLRLAVATLPQSECLTLAVYLPTGGRDDPPGLAGLAHFVEHMVFKGTARRSARQLSYETEDLGATMNAFTAEDHTVYEVRGEPDHLAQLADILADMIWASTYPAAEVELERGVIAEEIVMYEENPSDHISDLLSAALWSPHPLGQPISGTLETLGHIRRDDLAHHAAARHRDRRLVIAVAGPLAPAQILPILEPVLPEPATQPISPRFEPGRDRPRQCRQARETAQVQLGLGYRCFGRRDPRRHALGLLSIILGEGASSRLFQSLREEHGACYHIGSEVALLDDTGALEIHAGLEPSYREKALAWIRAELRQLATHGPSRAELARAKRLYRTQLKSGLESTAAHAAWAGESLLFAGAILPPTAYLEHIEALTIEDLRQVAHCVFRPENEALAEIHPPD